MGKELFICWYIQPYKAHYLNLQMFQLQMIFEALKKSRVKIHYFLGREKKAYIKHEVYGRRVYSTFWHFLPYMT